MDLEWERENPRDNVIAGTVGAFLGSLIGVACIVILSKLGYVSAVSGLVMAVCAIKGYALLGGKLTKRGAVISGLFILVMTYVATKLCFALAVMEVATEEVSFFLIYQSIGLFLEDSELRRIFLGELALQYLFTLVGGIPTLISSLRKPVKRPEGPAEPDEQPPIQGEFYALRKDWMRPLRLSVFVPLLVIMAISVGGFIATAFIQETRWMTAIVLGGFISGVFLLCWSIPTLQLCNAFHILFVRAGGKLWRVDLQHFCSVQNWWSQSSSKQAAIKWDVLCEISCLLDGETPSYGPGAVTELKDLQVEKEDNWSWTCFYESADGKRKKLRISKGYPDFCPVSGMERSQGPTPARWIFIPLSFAVTAALIAGIWALDMSVYVGPTWNRPQTSDSAPEGSTQPEVKSIPARVPEQITEYEMSEVWFRVDSGFKYSRRTFLDGDTGTLYRAYVQYGVDASDAWNTLSQHISEYRIQCYAVDCYEEYADLSDEEYRASLEAKREEITAFILEQCRTKRTNLYITAPVALHFAEHFEICRLCDREQHNAVGKRFMSELIDQLLKEGRLVSAETTHGAGIRTATARELNDHSKPVEQVAGQITMI